MPDQMMAATAAVDGGAGVLHIVKNYTGDVMNFEMAAEMAAADTGTEVVSVVTDDDVAVQDSTWTAGRRGVGVTVLLDGNSFDTADALFKKVGMRLVSTVGGASGPLYGTFFLRLGAALAGVDPIDGPAFGAALRAGVDGVVMRGKAKLDDKTMYDALAPALEAYDAAVGEGIGPALTAAASAAAAGRDRVPPMVARKGRPSYLGERSADHQDPGATSATLLLESAAATLS